MRPVASVLPLAAVTATSMLAMDLVLPAVPALQRGLGATVEQAQAVVAVFLLGLALSQLAWGELMSRWGPRRTLLVAGVGLVATSAGCALAGDIATLLVLRFVQGVAAGAAPVVATSVARASLSDEHAVRGIALIAMVESMVPAAGPVAGALLLGWTDWRGLFALLTLAALAVLPVVLRVVPRELPGLDRGAPAGWRDVLGNRRFRRLALSHALAFGALLMFVASAPQLMVHAMGRDAGDFALLQVVGVAGFASVASQSGRIAQRLGRARAVQGGALVQAAVCLLLVALSWHGAPPFALLAALWALFCGALAVRGPAAFAEALTLPAAQLGRASALMVLALLAAGALATQAVAPFMDRPSALPLAAGMAALTVASFLMVVRWPRP